MASGPVPLAYQWQFNSTNITWATNTSLILTNVQLINQGIYDVIIGNSYGSITSPPASLIVTGFPPSTVTIQPTNQAAVAGSNYSFTVTANGTLPLSYQWQFNSINLTWATNATLMLTNVQMANEGTYDVVVSNVFGSMTSSYVTLILLDLSTALNPGLTWTTGGNTGWFPETSVTHDGIEAAQSGSVSNGQQSVLQTTVSGPGTLSFWWRISSLGSVSFSINGVTQGSIGFITGWQSKTVYLGAGVQNLSWTYYGGTVPLGANAAWLDQVTYVPGGTAPMLTIAPKNQTTFIGATATFNSQAVGTPPLIYQWKFGATNLNNATNAILSLTNVQTAASGSYAIIVTNSYGMISTNAILLVQPFMLAYGPTNLLMTTNGFELQVGGVLAKNSLVIYASTNLINWLPIFTNPPTTGSLLFLDTNAANIPLQFYRAIEQ
jgi:hypothetical protein